MKELKFPLLSANDIECRIGTVSDKGVSLLLYKDARVDMRLLDEVVGWANWKREHQCLKNVIYCGVSIYDEDKKEWITKWDAGKESQTEAEKGEASDSFKRACFNVGIGRELYTAPFIWVAGANKSDRFYVKEVDYNKNREISKLIIINEKTKEVAYTFGCGYEKNEPKQTTMKPKGVGNVPVDKNGIINVSDIKVADTFEQKPTPTATPISNEHFIQLSAIKSGKNPFDREKFDRALEKMCGTRDLKEISDEQAVEIINKLSASN